ncbi:hypothetical protein [Ureaplasma zalophigenitalium]|uniref:Iron ABC transporter substrate-binding protein n=1 Tax=Ureaplasma zalophigenitalium TaxID=907723 RepID=A0ABT3BQQ1_9BACT|nr:hypothetical protein [Ureaplasma zalophigenitalium]MCV3754233.1 hypothetical protein [Ureaplasma zalophigenitalium]
MKKQKKWHIFSGLAFSLGLCSTLPLIAFACAKKEISEVVLRKINKPIIKINENYGTRSITAEQALKSFARNEKDPQDYTIFKILKPNFQTKDEINPDELSYEVINKPRLLGDNILFFEIKITYQNQEKIVEHIQEYISADELNRYNTKLRYQKYLKEALTKNKELQLDFFGVQLKPEYKNASAHEIKKLGDEALILNVDNPTLTKIQTYKNQPPFNQLIIKVTDLQIYETNDPENLDLTVEVSIFIGEAPLKLTHKQRFQLSKKS